MTLLDAFKVAGSALQAQRARLDTITSNLTNAETTRTEDGGPYRRLQAVFEAQVNEGNKATTEVALVEIHEDESPPKMVYDPEHPDANDKGFVAMPNVDVVKEMVDMISASRSYESATSAVKSAKAMANAALEIGS